MFFPCVQGLALVLAIGAGTNDPAVNQSEVLTRGLVHQAFAQPVAADPRPGRIVKDRPPAAINEIPPSRMPEGNNVRWIPGYWGWDDENGGYHWVSGLWRDVPPGQRWVPGYWAAGSNGFTWVRGFWVSADTRELAFLPSPPPAKQSLPTARAPGGGQFWVPGNWMVQDGQYRWKEGYWAPASSDWLWIPAGYVWTPRGTIAANGYWDYWPQERGLLFAPMRLSASRTTLIPQQVIPSGTLLVHLFVRPDLGHYCFGDYYDSSHVERGIYPWVHAGQYIEGHYDPIRIGYLTGVSSAARDEFDRIQDWHHFFRTRPGARPPATLTALLQRTAERDGGDSDKGQRSNEAEKQIVLVRPISQLASSANSSIRLTQVPESRLAEFRKSAQQTTDLADRAARLASARTLGDRAEENVRLALPGPAASSPAIVARAGRARGNIPDPESPRSEAAREASRVRGKQR